MQVADLMAPDGKVFLNCERVPISDYWPCVSFTKRSVGYRLSQELVPGRDVLVYVGTTNADLTEDPDHRSRLLSAVVIEPNQIFETRKLMPAENWARSFGARGDRWPHSAGAGARLDRGTAGSGRRDSLDPRSGPTLPGLSLLQ